ncbi:hypothetical protein EV663_10538 [Rhodovulum bhavnagarense]|uniref:Uncharacterized protein n=1 Tax=Rhodovulum bhavnagarense TaxID=992286 RepID=A0A4R2RD12_9RHOB|nr:hypothetical protein [Rhodovulum bhavnagarense]TCP61320.1 hypothetical protein EV663_10538 [Rhodovulum bhavnagarense]
MIRLIKILFFFVLLGFLGLVGYAYLGDLDPNQSERTQTMTLDVN